MDLIGRIIGKCRIVENIGEGGMAVVFKAYQPALDRYLAIKILPAEFAHKPELFERFAREARAVARLNHPNILPIYDFGQDEEGLSYIVMKYVAGGTLKDRLGRPLELSEITQLVDQIAAALDAPQHPDLGRDAGLLAGVAELGVPVSATLNGPVDAVIDFSVPAGAVWEVGEFGVM